MSSVPAPVFGDLAEAPSRYLDEATVRLRILSSSFEDIQTSRIRALHRGDEYSAGALLEIEKHLGRDLEKAVRAHALGPWLKKFRGLGGPRTGRVIACIGDPRRFPGQKCTEGHTLPPLYEPGTPCPITEVPRSAASSEIDRNAAAWDHPDDAGLPPVNGTPSGIISPGTDDSDGANECRGTRCPGTLLPPRTTTGTRSLWHYAGLHVVDGRAARHVKGRQSNWNPQLRTLCVGPKGLADQIVLHRTEPYRVRYDEVKAAKLLAELPPWRADKVAKTVAVKAFLGDLLAEWKRVVDTDEVRECV